MVLAKGGPLYLLESHTQSEASAQEESKRVSGGVAQGSARAAAASTLVYGSLKGAASLDQTQILL